MTDDDIEVIDLLSDSNSSCHEVVFDNVTAAVERSPARQPRLQRKHQDVIDVDAECLSTASSSSSSGIPGPSPFKKSHTDGSHRPASVSHSTSAVEANNDHGKHDNASSLHEVDDKDNTMHVPSKASNKTKSADSIISISSSSVANDVLTKRDVPISPTHLSRKRSPQNNLIGRTINTNKRRKRNFRRRDIEEAPQSHVYHGRKSTDEFLIALDEGRKRAFSSNEIRNEFEFIGDWWDMSSRFSEGEKKRSKSSSQEQQLCTVLPETVMVTSDNEQSVTSGVTLEPALSNSEVEMLSMSSSVECHTCERHSLLLGQIEELLECAKTIPEDESFITYFVSKIEQILGSIEEDADSGISIFYHECSGTEQFNPSLTIVKLLQVFDGLCQVCTIVTKPDLRWTPKTVIQQLFNFKKSGEYGVILRVLHLATYELIVSRGNFRHDLDHDHVLAVSYGLQMIATMMRNVYSDSRAKLQDTVDTVQFLNRPLECHKRCINRNCRVGNRGVTVCQSCGLRFHKSCFAHEVGVGDKCCPACKVSASLLKACTEGDLANIYSLVVEKGASPLQAGTQSGGSFETALHAAVGCNNYNMMSMLLFGASLLLNCDASLREWNFPSMAWGRDSEGLTPFERAIDCCLKVMNVRPPTEILLLLRNRGADGGVEDKIRSALEKRHKMMQVLDSMTQAELIHSDASMGMESVAVQVSESASLKTNFFYVSRSIESRETAIRWFDCRSGKEKRLSSFQGDCTKDKLKKLHHDQRLPSSWRAYCNYLCPSKGCSCQIEGLRFSLEIFETNGRGLGLRTAKGVSIKKGDTICNYVGEIVSASEAKRRDDEHAKAGEMGSYIINLDEKGDVCVDATTMRSVSAFINHSCAENNTYLFRALRHHLDEKFPYLVFRAKQDIGELQELTFNYVKGMPDGEKPTALCSQCNREHCLCHQCTEIEHRKHGVMV
mmetsp:Transcript_1492/g.2524  ORF Transcript_1492/g.2524 Transcript_1492/m.2524 type:complete len:948 (-) Transcript_1492:8-2851(-)